MYKSTAVLLTFVVECSVVY